MSVTLHTTLGPLKVEVFCESVPKTAEASLTPNPTTTKLAPSRSANKPSRTSWPSAHHTTTTDLPSTGSSPLS
jgi:hypothetical protein